jgi:hypothetical protein
MSNQASASLQSLPNDCNLLESRLLDLAVEALAYGSRHELAA